MRSKLICIGISSLLSSAAIAENLPADVAITDSDSAFILADTRGRDRRDDRDDDRDGRQDCRQDEGRVGDDKRDCKQDERQGDEDDA
jgi:hypothetical protein